MLDNFGWAFQCLKDGQLVQRRSWNCKDMFIFKVPGSTFIVNQAPLLGIFPEGTEINYRTRYDMKTADGDIIPWVVSQSDLDATDWQMILQPNSNTQAIIPDQPKQSTLHTDDEYEGKFFAREKQYDFTTDV
tara:strand:- start:2605 stop:3000 length:396 start_codon:yes stop_codon:yes gene_type:complete